MESPVLFIIFDRPESTQQVFERIRRAKPPRLYIAADGPETPADGQLCEAARAIAGQVDWPCEVKTLFRDNHLGADKGVSTSIDWFFEHEVEGIILEDDCVPEESFFAFCEELLIRYRDDRRIMHICGINLSGKWEQEAYGYYFSRYAIAGGWASWRRAWQLNDFSRTRYEAIRRHGFFDEFFPTRAEKARWFGIFNALAKNTDAQARWKDRWAFSRYIQSGLSIVPRESLVAHLPEGQANDAWLSGRPLLHPPYVMRSMEADSAYVQRL